ncbi:hypothetical protein D3C78_1193670 [compost metagenome]
MSANPITYNQQAALVDIPEHRIELHRPDHEFVKRLAKTGGPAKQLSFYHLRYFSEGKLIKRFTALSIDSDSTDPLLRTDQTDALRLLEGFVYSSLADAKLLRDSPYRQLGPDLQRLYKLHDLLMLRTRFVPGSNWRHFSIPPVHHRSSLSIIGESSEQVMSAPPTVTREDYCCQFSVTFSTLSCALTS